MLTSLLIILMQFQIGMVTDGMMSYGYSPNIASKLIVDEQYYIRFAIEARLLKVIFVRGSFNSPFNMRDITKTTAKYPTFSPDRLEYLVSAGLNYNGMELGFVHECRHPIFVYNGANVNNYTVLEGAYNEFYFKVDLKKEF